MKMTTNKTTEKAPSEEIGILPWMNRHNKDLEMLNSETDGDFEELSMLTSSIINALNANESVRRLPINPDDISDIPSPPNPGNAEALIKKINLSTACIRGTIQKRFEDLETRLRAIKISLLGPEGS